jgi:HlyD family secretion protein
MLVSGCTGNGDRGVTVSAVGYGTVAQIVQASANVTAKAQVSVSSPADGSVAVLDVADGQQVTAGQVLGQISSPSAQQELATSKQAVKQASAATASVHTSGGFTATAASARTSANKAFASAKQAAEQITDPQVQQAVLDQIAAAQSSYDSAFTVLSQTITEFQNGLASAGQVLTALGSTQKTQAVAAEQVAQQTVDALVVTAPISGTVTLGTGQAGSSAGSLSSVTQLLQAAGSSGSTAQQGLSALSGSGGDTSSTTPISVGIPVSSGGELFTVTDASSLSITAQVDETDILLVKPGVTAGIQLNAVPGATYHGTVLSVDPNGVTSSTGGVTYTVHLSLGAGTTAEGGAAPVPLPGMSAIADLNVLTVRHVLAIPSAALLTNGNTVTVWLVQNGVARSRQITLGAQGDTTVQVLSGLAAGDRIVTAGADVVTAGENVG